MEEIFYTYDKRFRYVVIEYENKYFIINEYLTGDKEYQRNYVVFENLNDKELAFKIAEEMTDLYNNTKYETYEETVKLLKEYMEKELLGRLYE
ncbi:Uncharacterised protein [[Flavobacterium] thermophilum]|nr:Uncharacterised protein [[Flavobacterium] thermophilum]